MHQFRQKVEALIFASEQAISIGDIHQCLLSLVSEEEQEHAPTEEDVQACISEIQAVFEEAQFSFQLIEIAGGFQFLTKTQYHSTIASLIAHKSKKRLSRSALEVLSIIAYKQPISKPEIEQIRGVNSDYAISKLLEKELVEIGGRSDGPGKPMQYITSLQFMNHFGLKSLQDLPQLRDIPSKETDTEKALSVTTSESLQAD